MIKTAVRSAWAWVKNHPATLLLMIGMVALAHFSPPQNHSPFLLMGSLGSTAVLDGLLKDFYDDEWVKSGVNDRHPLKDVIEERLMDKKYGGRRVIYGHHVSRNKSPFATGEYGLFAESDVQGHINITVESRKMMGRTILTPEAIADTADSAMAWEDAEENNFDRLVIDLARRDEMMLSYDGRGVLARINAANPDASSTVAVDSPGGVTGSTFGNRFFRVGEYIAAINPATGGIRAVPAKVTAVSADGTTITTDLGGTATAWADDDYFVKAANGSVADPLDTEYEHWFWGLLGIFDDGTYRGNFGGGDRTLWSSLNTYVNASTGALSIDTLQMVSDVMDQRSGGITSLMLCHHSVRRLVIKLTQADRRYAGEDLIKPDAGTVAFKQGDITMGEVPIKAIRDFPYGILLGIDVEMAKLRRYVSTKGEWVKDGDGRILVRSGTGSTARDAFEAWYRMRYQYWAKFPAAAWRLDGITGATVSIARPLGD